MPLPPIAKITWGAAFANTWLFFAPPDNPIPQHVIPGGDGSVAESGSGYRERWVERDDHELELIVRFIPKADSGSVTGYSTATTGVYEALKWLKQLGANQGRYYPDSTAGGFHTFQLVGDPEVSRDKGGSHYTVKMRIRDMNATAFTDGY